MAERMVDAGGFWLFLKDVGQGKPTVIIESAMGGSTVFWDPVQTEIAKTTRVIAYDRAGNGGSDVSPNPRTSTYMAKELHTMLQRGEVEPPYILVGASYGGFIARTFAHLYPEKVVGMVLVEPSHEDFLPAVKRDRTVEKWQKLRQTLDQMAAMGPGCSQQEWVYYFSNSELAREIGLPGDIPVVVLTSVRYGEAEQRFVFLKKDIETKYTLHKRWTLDKLNVKQIITHRSGHDIAIEEPALVINTIVDMVKELW